jgi:uncharacterized DUF497 family protein
LSLKDWRFDKQEIRKKTGIRRFFFKVKKSSPLSDCILANVHSDMYNHPMKFTWREPKRLSNLKKHGLDFADAEKIFSGPVRFDPDHRFGYEEERFIAVGLLDDRVVVIAHTQTRDETHIISMRKAERHERKKFFSSLY